LKQEQLYNFLQKYSRISYIAFYEANQNIIDETKDVRGNIVYSKDFVNHSKCLVSPAYFTNNLSFFTESQKHNTFLNRKLSINKNGDILNYLDYKNTFGSVNTHGIEDIISLPEFQELWFVHKEQIDVCKDCEFRHVCIDSREPLKRNDSNWYFQQECNYNPYICKWQNEEGYVPVGECGTYSKETGFVPNHEKIAELNQVLWAE
jgi:radical SAM protein with 4Fe4S-binding SPASM domain